VYFSGSNAAPYIAAREKQAQQITDVLLVNSVIARP